MASIKVPIGVTPIADKRLTLIAVLKSFAKKNGRLEALIRAVKKTMGEKGAMFVESEVAVGQLRAGGGGGKSFVDPRQLFDLVTIGRRKGKITLAQFFDVICVRTSQLPPILTGEEIAAISKPADNAGDDGDGSLYTDFKDEKSIDLDAIETAILGAVSQSRERQ